MDLPGAAAGAEAPAAPGRGAGGRRAWRCRCWPAGWPTPGGRGLSWAVGVPGSVGGAVRMNAGGHGSDMASCLRPLQLGRPLQRRRRHRRRRPPGLRLPLLLGDGGRSWWWRRSSPSRRDRSTEEQAAVAAIVRWRREHQPGGSNAGSVFTNPEGDSAGTADRGGRVEGVPPGHGARVGEARQLHSGGQGRPGRRRARADGARAPAWWPSAAGWRLRAEVRLLGFGGGKTGPVDGETVATAAQAVGAP